MINCKQKAVLYLALLLAGTPSYGAAIVTLTSPTSVQAGTGGFQNQELQSGDIAHFDETAHRVHTDYNFESAKAHLTLSIDAEAIRSSFDAFGQFSSQMGYGGYAYFSGSFSVDVVVDTPTPFYFEAHATTVNPNPPFGAQIDPSQLGYRFYTHDSNTLDCFVGATTGYTSGWAFTGVLLPGETYRLEFNSTGVASGTYRYDGFDGGSYASGSAVLVIPEPTSLAMLCLAGGALCLRRRREARYGAY